MADFLKWFQFAMSMLPLVLQSVQQVETVIGPGQGPIKKALVLSAISSVPASTDSVHATAIVSNMVDASIEAINTAQRNSKPKDMTPR